VERRKIFALFVMFNFVVISAIILLIIQPVVSSLRTEQANFRSLERRYFAERRLLLDYEDNLRDLAEFYFSAEQQILLYNEMVSVFAVFSRIGAVHGLYTTELSASEITESFFDGVRFSEMRVLAEYEGGLYDLLQFLYNLDEIYLRSFSVSSDALGLTDDVARLRLEFSLFGSD